MPTTTTLNGRPRRSLNDSIAKLDTILDGLSEAIPSTIRDTLQESVTAAVAEGVRAALLEVLGNGDLINLLRGLGPIPVAQAAAPEVRPAAPTLKDRLRAVMSRARGWAGGCCAAAAGLAVGGLRGVRERVSRTAQRWRLLWSFRKPLTLAAGVGCVVTVVALVAPGWLAATVSGVSGAMAAMGTQLWLWVRRVAGVPFARMA